MTSSSSMTLFSLSYLGNSIIQKSNDCELETIYELLMDYYLKFLQYVSICKPAASNNSSSVFYKTTLQEFYDTVILAIGNGHILIKSLDYKEGNRKEEKSVKLTESQQIDEKFSASELTYFNCYYFEVVTPVGSSTSGNTTNYNNNSSKNKKHDHCYAYFRRIIDTRRCIPEDALIRLDSNITNWLLRNRTIVRPPLIYFMIPKLTANGVNCLACYVFLAESVQIGLKVLRCFSELRKACPETKRLPTNRLCKCSSSSNSNSSNNNNNNSNPFQNEKRHYQAKNTTDRLDANQCNFHMKYMSNARHHCECCQRNVDYSESPVLSPRATKSHIDLLHRLNCPSTSETLMNDATCPQCNLKCCPAHSSLCELHRSKLIQMKLGSEAMDYYYSHNPQYQTKRVTNYDGVLKSNMNRRDRSVPARLENKMNHLRIGQCNRLCPLCQNSIKNDDREMNEHFSRTRYPNKINERTQSSGRYRQSCSPSHYISTKFRDNKSSCCHAHLGGSLELLP
ncbi:unnamed protein product [Trichobilharzia szidati]|nr:unnamed protein product [Trichobilharzia szidati]